MALMAVGGPCRATTWSCPFGKWVGKGEEVVIIMAERGGLDPRVCLCSAQISPLSALGLWGGLGPVPPFSTACLPHPDVLACCPGPGHAGTSPEQPAGLSHCVQLLTPYLRPFPLNGSCSGAWIWVLVPLFPPGVRGPLHLPLPLSHVSTWNLWCSWKHWHSWDWHPVPWLVTPGHPGPAQACVRDALVPCMSLPLQCELCPAPRPFAKQSCWCCRQGQGDAKLGPDVPGLGEEGRGALGRGCPFLPPAGIHAGQGWYTCGRGHTWTQEPAPCSVP